MNIVDYNECQIVESMKILSKKWVIRIICEINKTGMLRYNQLKRKLPGVTNMVLSNALKSLEEEGIIIRKQYNEIPPRVEYSLSEAGRKILPVLFIFSEQKMNHEKRFNCDKSCYNMFENYNKTIAKLDQGYLEDFHAVMTESTLIDMHTIDKIRYIFVRSFEFFNGIGKEAIRAMSSDFLREDELKSSLSDRGRPLYRVLDQLITEGREKGEVPNHLTNPELIRMIIIFTRGMTYDWELSDECFNIFERNRNIINTFFDRMKLDK